jgi:hypothetical protein
LNADKNKVWVIDNAEFLSTREIAEIKGSGKAGSYYRDKSGNSYYDILIPEKIRNTNLPFVILIQLKEIDKKDLNTYQQAIT